MPSEPVLLENQQYSWGGIGMGLCSHGLKWVFPFFSSSARIQPKSGDWRIMGRSAGTRWAAGCRYQTRIALA